MYEITLEDGTKLLNLELNGNNYISDVIIDDEVFLDNLGAIIVYDGDAIMQFTDMKLIQNKIVDKKTWFILAEKTKEEIEKESFNQLLADLAELVLVGGGM